MGEIDDVRARYPDVVRELERGARAFNGELEREIRPLGRLTPQESKEWTGH